jgi:hypothetical protein
MEDLTSQEFILLLQQTANQTDNHQGIQTLLEEKQIAFKEYVSSYYNSNFPAPKRFHFLKIADYLLNKIYKKHAEQIKKTNALFFKFWALLIDDARSYVHVYIETLKFQTKCPVHMLSEPAQSFPACTWIAQKIDLSEALVGFYHIDAIRLQDGSRPPFHQFAQSVGKVFGITFDEPRKELHRVLSRKKNQTPFFERIIAVLKNKKSGTDDINI